jgi:hypothetical protein
MKRLLILVITTFLCIAGAGLASAEVARTNHPPTHVQHTRSLPRTSPPTTNSASTFTDTPPNPPVTAITVSAPSLDDRATDATKVTQATQEILPNSQVGFEIFDRANSTVLASRDAGQQYAAMSVVKLLIALDVLAKDSWATPDEATQQQLHQMLANSDDQIADTLWTAEGGPTVVTTMASLLGLTGTQPPSDPGEWGDTLITPQDMVTVYRYITDQLPKPDHDIILGALSDTPKIAADGSDQYFGIPDGMPNTTWAIKQGWGTSGSHSVMNSTGLIGTDSRYIVVILTSAPESSYSTLPAVVTAAASTVKDLVTPAT